ncbi:MAG TPA: NADH-quinone oxidoreductase subunit M [Acidobacteriaceae bacterium]|nr:NADH-quinone oxidoreductase subunit M [Acidobacteriaceae bacterium]
MLNASILTLITFLPVLGAVIVTLLPKRGRIIPAFTLIFTLCIFLLTLHLPAHFNTAQHGFQFDCNIPWITSPVIGYHVGVDGLSLWLVVLVGLLAPLGVLISWRVIDHRQREFYSLLLLQQTAMYGIFVSLNLIFYYAFWELSLVPITLLIGIFGLKNGRAAATKFFLYAFIPSALLLVAILWLYAKTGTFDYVQLQQQMHALTTGTEATGIWWASLAFLLAFAVKVPVFPVHAWLADGISEAPTAIAMILAGKLGLYSLLRFHVGLFPDQAARIAPLMVALGVIGVLYGSLLALVQTDLRRLAAYATLAALSFCVLGIYAFTATSMDGSVYQILSESVSAGAFFMLLGILYERYGTNDMAQFGGVAKKMPGLATLFVITTLSLIGLPILNGFVGEFMILSGSFQTHSRLAIAATLGVILSAAYMLSMLQRVFYGAPSNLIAATTQPDVNWRERAAVWPSVALMIVMGVASVYWLRAIDSAVPGMAPPAAVAVHTTNYARMTTTR